MPRRNPSTVAESNAMAADPRRRVFVVFLDTYHVAAVRRDGGPQGAAGLLQATALGPDDLVAYMTPLMSGGDISFSTSTEPLLAYLDANPVWGVADEKPGTESDPIERDLGTCWCIKERGLAGGAVPAARAEVDRIAARPGRATSTACASRARR